MRFHIVSLPHTQTTNDYCWCAYTSKVRKFCDMMMSLGHEVYLYGGTENEASCKEFISVVSDKDRHDWFAHYDWDRMVFNEWNHNAACWQVMNSRAAFEINQRRQEGDFLGIIGGLCQKQISDEVPGMPVVEWGIGYEGILNGFHVFESNAWMHYVYGMQKITDGRFFDTVIPNSFDENDYRYSRKKDDYLLYLGRLTPRKGMSVVECLARRGHRIVMAGQGDMRIDGTEYVGVVKGEAKKELIAHAKSLLVPTLYIEPFGGVAIEAMLSGTPVITTDFGAFTETVENGKNGYRCHTLGEFEEATEKAPEIDPSIVNITAQKYLTDNVRYQYDKYFKRLKLLESKGWYSVSQ